MGFARIAALTHTMEDVFEMLRGRTGALERTRDRRAAASASTRLEAAVESIERDGDEQLDPTALIARLSELVRHPSEAAARRGRARSGRAPGLPEAVAAFTADVPLVRVTVALAADVLMPAVRAYMVLSAVADHGEMVWSIARPPTRSTPSPGRPSRPGSRPSTSRPRSRRRSRAVPDVDTVTVEHAQTSAEPAEPEPSPRPDRGRAGIRRERRPRRRFRPGRTVHAAPTARSTAATVRVDAERLDQLMH